MRSCFWRISRIQLLALTGTFNILAQALNTLYGRFYWAMQFSRRLWLSVMCYISKTCPCSTSQMYKNVNRPIKPAVSEEQATWRKCCVTFCTFADKTKLIRAKIADYFGPNTTTKTLHGFQLSLLKNVEQTGRLSGIRDKKCNPKPLNE